MSESGPFPVVDLFAGPGGLAEGFSAYGRSSAKPFRIAISIERDPKAHATLVLRGFFRQFRPGDQPAAYYHHLRGDLSRADLFAQYPKEAARAQHESWLCELGQVSEQEVDSRVRAAVGKTDHWVLIGGPPCQAYSLVGRSRMRGTDPVKFARDPRHFLYREYLRIIAKHRPPVFVMENVKGLLSATHSGENMFERILDDLIEPGQVVATRGGSGLRYRLHTLSVPRQTRLVSDSHTPEDFVLRSEEYGIPQARHRVIIVGVRDNVRCVPRQLMPSGCRVALSEVLSDLPRLRSQISRGQDSPDAWREVLLDTAWALKSAHRGPLAVFLKALDFDGVDELGIGAEFIRTRKKPRYRPDWYRDERLGGVCNHVSRRHLPADIQRYFFAAVFAAVQNGSGRSPVLADFPEFLLPNHRNVAQALEGSMFSDRFRVQLASRPSTTITSHLAKDGHYYIHPDPLQARSLTVREAARLQTFPDNYFFCGSRTSQYQQVGNAVPPLLAHQIAEIIYEVLSV